jgi:hypothetical protein
MAKLGGGGLSREMGGLLTRWLLNWGDVWRLNREIGG